MRFKVIFFVLISITAALITASCSLVESTPNEVDEIDGSQTGTIIIDQQTVPPGQAATVQFTGVPTGTITTNSTLVVTDLTPGTYTTTEVDPAPDFDVTAVECNDSGSPTPSSGDASTRTAVINLDQGETVRCTFTNTQRGSLVVAGQTIPDGSGGTIQFTGVPTGTIPMNGTLVVANLQPGTYTSTQVDPAPEFDLTAVQCDDTGSPTLSSGDPSSRSAIFNLDPGEMVTCTFTNTRRGSLVIANQTFPEGAQGTFQYTGVPTGTVSSNGTLIVSDLTPGTYTSTQVDPVPEFELTAVECDDVESPTQSSGDTNSRSAIFNLDPGEMVTCTFTNEATEQANIDGAVTVGPSGGDGGEDNGQDGDQDDGLNPFESPNGDLDEFPLPDELPPDAGAYSAPKPGPWSVTHFAGQMNCGAFSLDIPASPPESGVLEVLDGGQTVIGTGLETAQGVSITMTANPEIKGRYTGSFQGLEQGAPVTINYFWQVVTDEYIVGFLTATVTSQGVSCSVYRPYEMKYEG